MFELFFTQLSGILLRNLGFHPQVKGMLFPLGAALTNGDISWHNFNLALVMTSLDITPYWVFLIMANTNK